MIARPHCVETLSGGMIEEGFTPLVGPKIAGPIMPTFFAFWQRNPNFKGGIAASYSPFNEALPLLAQHGAHMRAQEFAPNLDMPD